MDETTAGERRRQERRWRERREADHPVFMETRLHRERRGGERRVVAADAAEPRPEAEGPR